jgi:hypothetical protein
MDSSTDGSRDNRVEDEDGEGGFSNGRACNAFASNVRRVGLETLALGAGVEWRCCKVRGFEKEMDELCRDADGWEE